MITGIHNQTLKKLKSKMLKLCRIGLLRDHDYDSSSLKVAYDRNMRQNMPHICSTCGIYAAYMCHIFCLKKFRIF